MIGPPMQQGHMNGASGLRPWGPTRGLPLPTTHEDGGFVHEESADPSILPFTYWRVGHMIYVRQGKGKAKTIVGEGEG